MMENTKKPSKMRGYKLEVPMETAMLCEKGTRSKKNSSSPPQETERRGRKPYPIQKKKCMYRGSAWVYETMSGIFSAEKSRGPHCRQRIFLDDPFHSDAASNGNSGCKSSSGQGVEETIPAWQLGKVKSKKEVILEAH